MIARPPGRSRQNLQGAPFETVDQAHVPIFLFQAMNGYDLTPRRVLPAESAKLGKPDQVKIQHAYGTTPQDGHSGFRTNAAGA
jgi:hypothetical protein